MPKMLHLADIHIGMENYGRTDPATGLNTRLLDYLARLDQVLDYALIEEPVDLVLIAGDIYKVAHQTRPTSANSHGASSAYWGRRFRL